MRTERFTTRAQEAIVAAQELAEGEGNPELTNLHLLLSLVDQPEGVVPAALERLGVQPAALAQEAREALGRLPKVSGGAQLTLSNETRRVLSDAHPLAERMHDEYVSTEHLLLAIIEEAAGSDARQLLERHGVTGASALEALSSIRGSQRVTSENPEATYQALESRLEAPAVDRQDGLRLAWDEEAKWLHLRPSGTEPILRIIAEAPTAEEARELVALARETLERAGGVQ